MMSTKEYHNIASNQMQLAIVAQAYGNIPESLRLFELAFEAEKQAALLLWSDFENEPTRSILFRSAATLALDCKKYSEAKRIVHMGLSGNPPEGMVDELLEVYERAHQELKLAEIPSPALDVVHKKPKASYFWLKGVLNTLNTADAQKHKITILSEDNKSSTVNVPKDLVRIVRNYWNEYVNAYILKQGKLLTLVKIDKIFMQKTA
jgi:hypothetical protein